METVTRVLATTSEISLKGGNRMWFDAELSDSPPFDPSGYIVAVDTSSGALTGLVRFWRNADGPRLGLIGVVPEHRGSGLAAALLKHAAAAACTWGHDAFVAETQSINSAVHPRLSKIGSSLGTSTTWLGPPLPDTVSVSSTPLELA